MRLLTAALLLLLLALCAAGVDGECPEGALSPSVPFWGTQAPNAIFDEIQGSELGTECVEG